MRGKVDDSEYYIELGKNLLKIREEQRLLQKDIADKMGITFQQYQKYERGINRIPTKALVTFCEITNTDIKEITGCTVGDYEKTYKEAVVNYNTNNNVTNVYHNYSGFFSNLLNIDLNSMKNKISVIVLSLALAVYFGINLLKFFPEANAQYNIIFLQIQICSFMIAFAVTIFSVFSYCIFSYLFGYIAFYAVIVLFYRVLSIGSKYYLNDMMLKLFMQVLGIALTILTFYILKKYKVNINVRSNEKEA